MNIKTILVPTDFSEDANAAIDAATSLAKTFGARIHVIHAYHMIVPMAASPMAGPVVIPEEFYAQLRENAETQVAELVERVRKSGVEVEGQAVLEPASMAIAAAAERVGADLIVMGTRGLTGLKHVVLGSVAERTLRHAPCPVLTV